MRFEPDEFGSSDLRIRLLGHDYFAISLSRIAMPPVPEILISSSRQMLLSQRCKDWRNEETSSECPEYLQVPTTARTAPPAITPVPGAAGLRNTRPAPYVPVSYAESSVPLKGTVIMFFRASLVLFRWQEALLLLCLFHSQHVLYHRQQQPER